MTKEEAVECVVRSLPYPQHIKDWDLSQDKECRFTWRDERFRLSLSDMAMVEHVVGDFLHGDNLAIAIEALITNERIRMYTRKSELITQGDK